MFRILVHPPSGACDILWIWNTHGRTTSTWPKLLWGWAGYR